MGKNVRVKVSRSNGVPAWARFEVSEWGLEKTGM